MENSTSAGTPLATQNAPRQSIDRTSSFGACPPEKLAASTVIISLPGKVFCRFCDAVIFCLFFNQSCQKMTNFDIS
jgi:hypothetical protein